MYLFNVNVKENMFPRNIYAICTLAMGQCECVCSWFETRVNLCKHFRLPFDTHSLAVCVLDSCSELQWMQSTIRTLPTSHYIYNQATEQQLQVNASLVPVIYIQHAVQARIQSFQLLSLSIYSFR